MNGSVKIASRKSWIELRDNNKAYCSRCGAISIFVEMRDWNGKHKYSFFDWWKKFKQFHTNCVNKNVRHD